MRTDMCRMSAKKYGMIQKLESIMGRIASLCEQIREASDFVDRVSSHWDVTLKICTKDPTYVDMNKFVDKDELRLLVINYVIGKHNRDVTELESLLGDVARGEI